MSDMRTDVWKQGFRRKGFPIPKTLRAQIGKSIALTGRFFNDSPAGLCPRGLCLSGNDETLSRHGIKWAATDEDILFMSLREPRTGVKLFRPYRVSDGSSPINMFFRDRCFRI